MLDILDTRQPAPVTMTSTSAGGEHLINVNYRMIIMIFPIHGNIRWWLSQRTKAALFEVEFGWEPAQLLTNIHTTGHNFERAWNILITKYDNKRVLVISYLDILKPIVKKNARELRFLLNDSYQAIEILKAMNRPTNHWDNLLVYMGEQRFNHQTKRAWEELRPFIRNSTNSRIFDRKPYRLLNWSSLNRRVIRTWTLLRS